MIANQPVPDADVAAKATAEADKAAAAETMPPPKHPAEGRPDESDPGRLTRRGQDAPEQDIAVEEDS